MSSEPEKSLSSPNGSEPATHQAEKQPEGGIKDYFRIFQYADGYDWTLNAIACSSAIASGAALPLMSLVFGTFTTKFNNFASGRSTPQQFRDDVDHFVLWFIYLFIGRFAATYVATGTISISAIRTTRSFRKAFLEATLRQEIWHFDRQTNGATATQVTTNGNRIQSGIAEKLVFVMQGLSMFLASFVVALAAQWKLALITMSVIPAIFIVTGVCIAIDAVQEARVLRIYSRAAVLAEEVLSSIRTVHAFYAQKKMVQRYDTFLQEAHKEGNKKSPNYGVLFSTQYFCVYSAIALSFWQGFRMFQSGEIESVGKVFTVVLSVTIAATAISSIAPQIQAVTNASSAASELFSVIDKPSLLDPLNPAGAQPSSCGGQIEITGLEFAYPSRPGAQVLRGLTVSIPAGKTTALVGASGCGKSTLVGLLERWYLPTAGHITLDGLELDEYNVRWLRSQIRLVQQEPVLFRGTVFENVAKGFLDEQRAFPHEKQMELVREACKASNADEFINELPQGYETQVGERAGTLSGGQRQRIAIARSIVSDPKILLLDEATSALDPRAERLVQDALNRVSENRTTLVIAHKLATVKTADNIAVMSYGRIVEQGTHQQLIHLDGHYAGLVRAQDLGSAEQDESSKLLSEKQALEVTDERLGIQRTITTATSEGGDAERRKPPVGTLDYSLLRCIFIMFYEQKSLYWCFFVSTVASLIGGGTYPAQAVLFSRLLTIFQLTGKQARDRADFYSLMFFVVALGNLVAYFTIGWICNIIGQTVTHRYRSEMFERVLDQDIEFFDLPDNTSGALTSKLSTLPNQLQELVAFNILLIFIVVVNVVSSSILALAYGWKLGLVVVFGALPPLLLSGYLRIRLETKLESQVSDKFAESAGLANEAVSSIRTVASLTLEAHVLEEYSQMLSNIVLKSTRSLVWTMFWFSLSQSIVFLAMALGFWYGSRLLSTGEYSTGQFYTIFVGVLFAGQAAGEFFGYTTSITKARSAANYILWLRTLQPTIRETDTNKSNGPEGDGPVDLEEIEFRYRQRETSRVIRGISMSIQPGQFAAFVGASGCGKSTLVALLERFYDPTSGRICFAHKDVATITHVVPGSVRENVSLGLAFEPSEEQIREACRQANALDFVISLPEGFDTPCGSRGTQLSGGQRQRVAIARALIRNPQLLLLDEATSALDTLSERLVQAALDEAAVARTTVAVAHRLSTIRAADVIFVIANGRIAETGTHAELQQLKGRYYEMCLAQSLDRA
ncbi:ABC transporter transmembrane domain-containing protein [Cladophialophora immunda]|nr:ABC transporter transmembrane domain-containing protein [Cladophialophora immunda]